MILKYLTAYGVENWNDSSLLGVLAHFDMAAIDHPGQAGGGAAPGPIRATYSHSQLKLLAYIDTAVDLQGQGFTVFSTSSPAYWGYQVEALYASYQAATGNAFDGVFLDNTYDQSCGDYPLCKAGNGGAPYAGYQDYRTLGQWLTGKLSHARQIPTVLENGGDAVLASCADLWMLEGFPSNAVSKVADLATQTSAGHGAVALCWGYSDTQANCLWGLACFLCGATAPGTAYFAFSSIWNSSMGYYPMMDTDYGTPLGPSTQSGNVLTRQYTKCTVTVDPTTTGSASIVMKTPNGPVAAFAASPGSGVAPLSVQFTDTSTGSPTSWLWDFGDGSTSTAENPSHVYALANAYTVKLTINGGSSATATITVTSPSSSTFGDSAVGEITGNIDTNGFHGCLFTAPGNGNVTKFSLYCRSWGSGRKLKPVLVRASDNVIVGVGNETPVPNAPAAWLDLLFATPPPIVANTDYLLGFVSYGYVDYQYTAGALGQGREQVNNNYGSPTNPSSLTMTSEQYSIYATYTPSAPGSFSPGSSHTGQIPVTVTPKAGLACQAELYLGPDPNTKTATSGPVAFTSTGASQQLSLPVVMPAAATYHVYLRVTAGTILFASQFSDVTVS